MKRKKDYSDCVPLAMVQKMSRIYPDAWEKLDRMHALHNTSPEFSWPEWCWLPMAGALSYVKEFSENAGMDFTDNKYEVLLAQDGQMLSALAPWRHSKQIYVYNETLEQELTKDSSSADRIPTEALLHLPYPCIYIKTNHISAFGFQIDGFFVHLEYDEDYQEAELRFLPILKDQLFGIGVSLHISGNMTMAESYARFLEVTKERIEANPKHDAEKEMRFMEESGENRERLNICRTLLPLVLYLCSDESDVLYRGNLQDGKQRQKEKRDPAENRPPEVSKEAPVKDRYSEVRAWDVGFRIGPEIRKYYTKSSEGGSTHPGEHTPKRLHIRRAHWHHYWRGPREGERQLIVRWLAPMYINSEEEDDEAIPAVIHPVH